MRVRLDKRAFRTVSVNCHLAGHGILCRARVSRKTRRTTIIRARVSRKSSTSLRIQAHNSQRTYEWFSVKSLVSRHAGPAHVRITASVTIPMFTAWLVTDVVYTGDDSDVLNKPRRLARNLLPSTFVLYVTLIKTPAPQVIEAELIENLTEYTGWHVLGATFINMTGATKLYAGVNQSLRSTDPA